MINSKEFKSKLIETTSSYLNREIIKDEDERNSNMIDLIYEIDMLMVDWEIS